MKATGGSGVASSDEEILQAMELLAETEGIFTEPAGGATLAGAMQLVRSGVIAAERIGGRLHHRKRLQDGGGNDRARASRRAIEIGRSLADFEAYSASRRRSRRPALPQCVARCRRRLANARDWRCLRRSDRLRPEGHRHGPSDSDSRPRFGRSPGKQEFVEVEGSTVGDALQGLVGQYGDLRRHLYNEDGRLRSFVNIYVNDEDIRHLDREQTALKAGDTISIVPSVAGGSGAAVREARGADARRSAALQPAPDHAGGRRRGAAQAEGGARAVRRRGRARSAGRRCISRRPASARSASSTSTSVDASNLHRQIIYGTPDVGKPQARGGARSAARR